MTRAEYRVQLVLEHLPADRICALLEAVGSTGSLRAATMALGCSYRYAWELLRRTEQELGAPLLEKRTGGTRGGGSVLTEAARDLLRRYRHYRGEVREAVDALRTDRPEAGTGGAERQERPLLIASTIGPIETGILPHLEESFYRETGLLVRHIAAGTGQALSIAREGLADLVLAHAPGAELDFMARGFGSRRRPLMSNDFLMLGPKGDPAGVRKARSAVEALLRIASKGTPFVTRGDRSGTHTRELELWAEAGVTPEGPWYLVSPEGALGSGRTLRYADSAGAYVLIDRATYLTCRLQVPGTERLLLAGDPLLANLFSLILVNPGRYPQVREREAEAFMDWVTGPTGQGQIARFGLEAYGEPLFLPGGRT